MSEICFSSNECSFLIYIEYEGRSICNENSPVYSKVLY